jgi:hypothetical protein
MNISFNIKKTKVIEDSVKEQINFYKLHIEENDRYFTGFDVFQDDNKIVCYVNEHEIQLTYDGIKLVDIECETDEESIKALDKAEAEARERIEASYAEDLAALDFLIDEELKHSLDLQTEPSDDGA